MGFAWLRQAHGRLILFAILIVSLAFGSGFQVNAQALPATLAGETLTDYGNFVTDETGKGIIGACDPTGTSTITINTGEIDANNSAIGPYPGNFVETGTFTFGPQPQVIITPGDPSLFSMQLPMVPLLSYDTHFVISTSDGQVEGTKTLVSGSAACGSVTDPVTGYVSTYVVFTGTVRYEAYITTPSGDYFDSGTATISGNSRAAFRSNGGNSFMFQEVFVQSDGVMPVMPQSKEQCKDGGYAIYGFPNQGQCIQYVNNGN
jgi:hypothetical protein